MLRGCTGSYGHPHTWQLCFGTLLKRRRRGANSEEDNWSLRHDSVFGRGVCRADRFSEQNRSWLPLCAAGDSDGWSFAVLWYLERLELQCFITSVYLSCLDHWMLVRVLSVSLYIQTATDHQCYKRCCPHCGMVFLWFAIVLLPFGSPTIAIGWRMLVVAGFHI